jgi:hypothetical protein
MYCHLSIVYRHKRSCNNSVRIVLILNILLLRHSCIHGNVNNYLKDQQCLLWNLNQYILNMLQKNEEPLFANETRTEEVEPNEMDSVYANIDDIIDGLDIEQERKHEKADSNAGICFK